MMKTQLVIRMYLLNAEQQSSWPAQGCFPQLDCPLPQPLISRWGDHTAYSHSQISPTTSEQLLTNSCNLSPIYFHLAATSMVTDRMPPKSPSPVRLWRWNRNSRVHGNSAHVYSYDNYSVYMYFSYLVVSHPLLSYLSLCRNPNKNSPSFIQFL